MAALIWSPGYASYDFGEGHPFSPVRTAMTLDLLARLGHPLVWREPRLATREELATVHDEAFIAAVEWASAGRGLADGAAFGLGTPDTPLFEGIDEAARLLVGGTLTAAHLIGSGAETRVLQLGGGLHHAHSARASGFCVYNDLAVAIRHLVSAGMYVTYVDIDVHHGDGVQAVFLRDDKVQTISLHESGQYLFPGTGEIHELGLGMGRGLKINLPLEPFTEGDGYLDAFETIVPPAIESFGPHVIVLQAGADAHFDDPLADLALTTRDYERLFRRIVELAEAHSGGRLLVTLGGGYSMHATSRVWAILYLVLNGLPVPEAIPHGWAERWATELGSRPVSELHDPEPAFEAPPRRAEIQRHNRVVVSRLHESLTRFWY
jgi:acetoin utilization protein AcuC